MAVGISEGKIQVQNCRQTNENANKTFCGTIKPERRIVVEWGPHWCQQNSWLENVIYGTISM